MGSNPVIILGLTWPSGRAAGFDPASTGSSPVVSRSPLCNGSTFLFRGNRTRSSRVGLRVGFSRAESSLQQSLVKFDSSFTLISWAIV